MNAHQTNILNALEIQHWTLREQISSPANIETELHDLRQKVSVCTACSLHCSRTQTVFGEGNPHAKLMFIGEAPGFNEDKQGKPFVGRAGKLLTEMLKAIQLTRDEIFIANVLKCRPPNNRDPQADEIALCTNYLNQQIQIIQPNLLVALGRVSAHYLLQTNQTLERMRKESHRYGPSQIPLIVTYHPAYLLRNPADKKKSYEDLLKIKAMSS